MSEYIEEMAHLAGRGDAQGVLFWIAVYAFVVCSYSTIRQFMKFRWKATTGQLMQKGIQKFGTSLADPSMQEYKLDALYEYQVDGRKYLGTEVSAWKVVASHNVRGILGLQYKGIEKHPDGSIAVYYNPRKPQKALLVLPGWKSQLVTMAIGLAPSFYYLYRFG